MLSVYTRHSSDCPRSEDRTWKRCRCPKWIWGTLPDGEFIRRSAKTRTWEQAEELRREIELHSTRSASMPRSFVPEPNVDRQSESIKSPLNQRITIDAAVEKYLADAKSRDLESSTLSKLTTIFRKQFLVWGRAEGFIYLDELDLDAMKNFRSTWEDGPLAKSKKQDRIVGFFWACVRRGYIAQNPCIDLGKIKVHQIPTDYFSQAEFAKIIDATYVYGDARG